MQTIKTYSKGRPFIMRFSGRISYPDQSDSYTSLTMLDISRSHRFVQIKKGTRFQTLRELAAKGLIHWNGPLTTGFRCMIPKGTILVALRDSSSFSLGFGCVPENSGDFECKFVPEADRTASGYAGYSIVFTRLAIGRKLRML
jgi:hypothetical protein